MSLDGLHILLAEDNATNQMVAMQMLESLGANVTLAADGAEALEVIGRTRFDLALIDIEMPRVSGTEVIRRLRAGPPPACDMPLIALTAYVMREHREAIDDAGADGTIAKPILSIDQLGQDVLALCRKRWAGAPPSRASDPGGADDIAASAHPSAPQRIDMEVYRSLADSIGPAAMADLLEKIESDLIDAQAEIQRGRRAGQEQPIRRASHVLVSVAGAIGADALQMLAQRLNSAAHSREFPEVICIAGEIFDEIDGVLAFVRERRRR